MQIVLLLIIIFINSIIEFLPISSTAHNILFFHFLKLENINLDLVLIFSQLAITFSVCCYFRKKIINILLNFFFDKNIRIFCYKIILTAFPACLFGLFFYGIIKNIFYANKFLIAIFLIIGGVIMIFIEKNNNYDKNIEKIEDVDLKLTLKIALFQAISLIPGISRSASTICSGIFFKLKKELAVEYSFFISIPISILSCFLDIYKNVKVIIMPSNFKIIIISFIFSFIFSLFFIKMLLNFVKNNNLKFFGYYRILVGLLLIILLL